MCVCVCVCVCACQTEEGEAAKDNAYVVADASEDGAVDADVCDEGAVDDDTCEEGAVAEGETSRFNRFAALALRYMARVRSLCSRSNSSSTDWSSAYGHHRRLDRPSTRWDLPSGVRASAALSCWQAGQRRFPLVLSMS